MISLILAAKLLLEPKTVTLEPTEDIWVYSHASDPGHDIYMRVWGADGHAVAPSAEESDEFSYGYLKFDLASLPKGKIVEATLEVTQTANPEYTADYIKDNPLQARSLKPGFTEKSWEYDIVRTLSPGPEAKAVYGSGFPSNWPDDKPFPIAIDLLKGPGDFRAAVALAQSADKNALAIALTSTNDVSTMGSKAVYKVYSRDSEKKEYHPTLKLRIEPQ